MRLDEKGDIYVLEVNSLPSLGEHGSYVAAAAAVGLDFPALVNRLAEVAAARYFGTPNPPDLTRRDRNPKNAVPLGTESSLWPSVAGLVADPVPVVCGLGPVAQDLYTSREAVSRISLVQRTLLLAQLLLDL